MKALCKRTYFHEEIQVNQFLPKRYVAFEKNKIYNCIEPEDYEKSVGFYLKIQTSEKGFWLPFNNKDFDKYFVKLDEYRNKKIDEILN